MKPQTEKLYQYVLSKVDPSQFYADTIVNQDISFDRKGQALIWCPFHNPSGKGQSPSLSISLDGKFFCHSGSCAVFGSNIINFYERLHNITLVQALDALYKKYISPVISPRLVEQYHANLMCTPYLIKLLKDQRGIEKDTLVKYSIGYDNDRITIPVLDEFGQCVNIRRYDHSRKHELKILNYASGFGSVRLYPIQNTTSQNIILCEGEWDALLATQKGFPAVTATNGVGAWKEEFNQVFKGKDVVICFDVNDPHDAGQICAKKRLEVLLPHARTVKILELPLDDRGGDITDYFHKYGQTSEDFKALIDEVEPQEGEGVAEEAEEEVVHDVTLGHASKAEFYNQKIRFTSLVAGKDPSPFLLPHEIKISCGVEKRCAKCPLGSSQRSGVFVVDPTNPDNVLFTATRPSAAVTKYLRSACGFKAECDSQVEVLTTFNAERLQLIPELDMHDQDSPYVMRDAYYVGHGLESNRSYEMLGCTVSDPKTQQTVHVIQEASPAQTSVETFRITPDIRKALHKVFSTDPTKPDLIWTKMMDVYQHFSQNVTRIFDRPDLHMAVDLVYHSPLQFNFNNEFLKKGWLDVLILGDARTGKGLVAEGLQHYYGMGDIASAENCSFAGLIGGVQQTNTRWMCTWGKIPLNDKRLVILDEVSNLSYADIEKMSRVRSEGRAEITKIQTERTNARTRLIWLGNPRSINPLSSYNTGVEAIKELIGKPEDIARFDYAMCIQSGEVNIERINRSDIPHIADSPYTSDLCRQLVLWVWSRRSDEVVFTTGARELILRHANALGKKYSSTIPLVQGESIRHKIARIAASIAGRIFSSTEDGSKILVTEGCVETAIRFLKGCYDSSAMGYLQYSTGAVDRDVLKNVDQIDQMLNNIKEFALDLVQGLLRAETITSQDISDFSAQTNRDTAMAILSMLVRNRAITRVAGHYTKKPAFIQYLRKKEKEYQTVGVPKLPRKTGAELWKQTTAPVRRS